MMRSILYRAFSSAPTTKAEKMIHEKLFNALQPSMLSVRDISGGCGSMFAIEIKSDKFKGLRMLKQHQLVQEVLKEDIKKMHGLQIKTLS